MVQVAEVKATPLVRTTEIIGQLDSPQNVQVRARVEAFVTRAAFVEGVPVREGDLLFELDKRPYLERSAAAKGALAEAEASLTKYERDVARLVPLAEKRAIPSQDLENARAAVEVARAGVASAKARVESAALDVEYCDVRAPIAGLIGAKQVSVGDLVGKGEPTLLATISTQDPIWFYCSVSETEYLRAEHAVRETGKRVADLPVSLVLSDGSVHPQGGKFVFIDRAVDPKTGTLRVRAEFPNPEKILKPGMFGRIRVELGAAETLVVPERAVAELQGRTFVWVVSGESVATQRKVTVGEASGAGVIVTDGLKPGERIVVEGLQKVREGQPVQAMAPPPGAEGESAKPAASGEAPTKAH